MTGPPRATLERQRRELEKPDEKSKCLMCAGQVPTGRVVCDTCHRTRPAREVTAALQTHLNDTIRPILEAP